MEPEKLSEIISVLNGNEAWTASLKQSLSELFSSHPSSLNFIGILQSISNPQLVLYLFYDNLLDGYERQMWRFARIFEPRSAVRMQSFREPQDDILMAQEILATHGLHTRHARGIQPGFNPQKSDHKMKMDAFLCLLIQPIQIDHVLKMRSVNDRVTSLNDWRDLSSEQQVCINLELRDDHKICEIGEQVFQHIRRKISPQLVTALLVLAYNLRDDCNHECFGSIPNDLQSTTFMTEWDRISNQSVIGFILSVKLSMRAAHEDILESRARVFSYLSVNFED